MGDLFRSVPKAQQVCPMCRAVLPAGARYCESCGTDLGRSGVLFSSSVRPVTRRSRWRVEHLGRIVALVMGALAAAAVLLVGIGTIPTVSARVPVLRTIVGPIQQAFSAAVEWGSQMMSLGREQPPTQAPPPAPAPPVAPAQKTVPAKPAVKTAAWDGRALPDESVVPYLIVRSTPDSADVFLNAERAGKTPLALKKLRPGVYVVRLERKGYAPAAQRVELRAKAGRSVAIKMKAIRAAPAPAAKRPPTPQKSPAPPAGGPTVIQAGSMAPDFILKDRLGVLYRLSDYRGRRVAVLFIWELDEAGKRAVRALNQRMGGRNALVVLMRPDRVELRRFISEGIGIPILFAERRVAAQYRVPRGTSVLYVISEQGLIQSRQVAPK